MTVDVHLARFLLQDSETQERLRALLVTADTLSVVSEGDLVAIKIHVGEQGNTTHLRPQHVRCVADGVRARGGKPYLTDTNVLYQSQRSQAVDHALLAHEHGFTVEATGCPFIVSDGLVGRDERSISIAGKHYSEVSLASGLFDANAVIVISHFTGHIAAGFGATLKNLGMGFASRRGKLLQHCDTKPFVRGKSCKSCGLCVNNCPAAAITLNAERVADINAEACIGCGECLTVCRHGAIGFNWSVASQLLQEKIAEHALGVHTAKKGKIAYLNLLCDITPGCDCMTGMQSPVVSDIGAVASCDPVALDKASCDLIREATGGSSIENLAQPDLDGSTQLTYAAALGLGTLDYRLYEI